MTDNTLKLAQLYVSSQIQKIVNTGDFRRLHNSNVLVAHELMYNLHFTAEQVKASGVAGSNGVRKAKYWIKFHSFPGRPGPDTVLFLEEEEELVEQIHREIFERNYFDGGVRKIILSKTTSEQIMDKQVHKKIKRISQILKSGKYTDFSIWSFDETNVQFFFSNSILMVTDAKSRYQFRCGSSPRPNYTLSLCVSAAG
ncbi:MAG: hypothetical protein EZS28_028135 [Streblomastix strix]|uniref:Uncharacterized protein n=1 Tax=Streblomastix strix TaxID=222440 RepID=A0A5J4V0W5_9EUKA|nr:MAG: hypothetical protein EZS28_028135 [Streblomastix strix]